MKITSRLLINFIRHDKKSEPDTSEMIGDLAQLFNVGFGKVINYKNGRFENSDDSLMVRIFFIVCIIFSACISVPMICVGFIALSLSKTHKDLYSLYKNSFQDRF